MSNFQITAQAVRAEMAGQLWAIMPDRLRSVMAGADVASLQADQALLRQRGEPLRGAYGVEVRDGVAIIQIKGMIFPELNLLAFLYGGTSLQALVSRIEAALASDEVDHILLEIDSPGGVVTGVSEAARVIREAAKQKPVTAWTNGYIASAAYWLASAADEIVMSDTAMAGSIGIVTAGEYQESADRDGYRQIEITSTNATDKRPDIATEQGRAVIRERMDALEALFIDQVAENREVTREKVLADFGRGRVFVAADAVARGMADRVMDLEPLLAELAGDNAGGPGTTAGNSPFMTHANKEEQSSMTKKATQPAEIAGETTPALSADDLQAQHPDAARDLYDRGFQAGNEAMATAAEDAAKAATAAERTRITAIQNHAAGMDGVAELVAQMIDDGTSADAAAGKLLEAAKAKGGEIVASMRDKDAELPKLGATASETADVDTEAADTPDTDDFSDEANEKRFAALTDEQKQDFGSAKAYAAYLKAEQAGIVRIQTRKAD